MSDQRFSILVVDDNPLNLKLLETALSKDGFKVLSALDGPTARELAQAERPNLILLDIQMPGEDGFDVIRFLKNDISTMAIPVIFLTGVSDIDAKLSGFELGAVDYITKPFHPLEVLARVRLHLKLSIATNSLISDQAQKLKQISEAQTALLTTPDMHPEATFGVYYLSLQEAGGDFYDVLPISQDIYGYLVADFSGHDIKTSYLTAAVKALLKQNATPVYQPLESIKMMNDVLVEILPDHKYLTACYARLNRKSKQMTIINAAHPPVVYVPKGGDATFVEVEGDVLGIFKEAFFGRRVIDVHPGDRFYMYSDGLVESAENRAIWSKKLDLITEACEHMRDIPIQEVPRRIVDRFFGKGSEPEDDVVVLAIQI